MTTSTVAQSRIDARPEPARFRSRPLDQYWDVWQARWVTAGSAADPIPAPRRGD